MSHLRAYLTSAALVLLLALASGLPAYAQQKMPDSGLYTQYSASQTEINWLTCGSLPLTNGCYGSGELGPFTDACSVVQSVPLPTMRTQWFVTSTFWIADRAPAA